MSEWKYQNTADQTSEGAIRRFIILTFEFICIAGVMLITLAVIIVALVMISQDRTSSLVAVLMVIGTFLVAAFVSGAALTLSDIARNTRRTAEALVRLENRPISRSQA